MSAQLHELLSDEEITEIERTVKSSDDINFITRYHDVKLLTVKQLSDISLILFRTEYPMRVPPCILSAECIHILVRRAEKKKIGIF